MRDWLTILLRLRSPMICCLPDEGFKKPVESQFKFYSLRIRVANDVSPSLSLVVQEPCVQMSQGRRRWMYPNKQRELIHPSGFFDPQQSTHTGPLILSSQWIN